MIERIKINVGILLCSACLTVLIGTMGLLLILTGYNILSQFSRPNYRIQQYVDREHPNTGRFKIQTDIYLEYRNNSVNIKESQTAYNVHQDDVFLVLDKQQEESERIIKDIEESYGKEKER